MLETSDWNNRHNSATEGGPVRIETDSTRRSSSQDSRESKSDSGQSKQAANSCEDMIVEAVDPNVNLYSSGTNQQVRSAMDAFQAFRYLSGTFVNSEKVQLFIVSLIAINALMMGIATFDFVREDPSLNNAFEIVDQIFLIIFTIELAMQFAYHGWRLLLDGWLCFDLIVIAMSWSFSSVQIIRAFRIFRALRLITRIKVMKNLVLGTFDSVLPLVDSMHPPLSVSNNFFPYSSFRSHASHVRDWAFALFGIIHFRRNVYTALQRLRRARPYRC
jgi:hypothetical protein